MTSRISTKDAKRLRDPLRSTLPAPKRKYGNVKRQYEGITFDSSGELTRWMQLCMAQERGEISALRRQVKYVLCPPVRLVGESRAAAVTIVIDFEYLDANGKLVAEDYKGVDLPIGRMKRRLLKHVHGIDVVLSGKAKRAA